MKQHVDAEGDAHQYNAQGDGKDILSLVVFEGHGGGHRPGEPLGVAAEHHPDPDLGDDPAESGDDRGDDTESGFLENHQGRLNPIAPSVIADRR